MSFPNFINFGGGGPSSVTVPMQAPNGAIYVALTDGPNLAVFKSTDGGVTWSTMDAAHAPVGGDTFASVLNGTTIYVVHAATGPPGPDFLQVTAYDTATDKFGVTTITGNDNLGNPGALWVFFRTSDLKLIVSAPVASLFIGGKWRTGYFTFDTGALTSTAWVANGETGASAVDWAVAGILAGSGETEFLFWSRDSTGPGGTRAIWRQPLSDAGVLGAVVQIDSVTDAGSTRATPAGFSDGSNATVIWAPTDASLEVKVFKAPVATWVFVVKSLNAPATEAEIDSVGIVNSLAVGVMAFLETRAILNSTGKFWVSEALSGTEYGPFFLIGAFSPGNAGQTNGFFVNLFGDLFALVIIEPASESVITAFWLAGIPVITLTFKGMKVYGG